MGKLWFGRLISTIVNVNKWRFFVEFAAGTCCRCSLPSNNSSQKSAPSTQVSISIYWFEVGG
jgi:hypothetical protein